MLKNIKIFKKVPFECHPIIASTTTITTDLHFLAAETTTTTPIKMLTFNHIFAVLVLMFSVTSTVVVMVLGQPADLGTFGTQHHNNDLPNSVSSYSMPSSSAVTGDERMGEPFVLAFINYSYVAADDSTTTFAEEKGKYGEGRVFSVRGLLVHVTARYDEKDHTACGPHLRGTRGRELPPPKTWIALIKRGNCNFEDKVKHAWLHDAAGVIVYNDRDSSSLDKMKIAEKERKYTIIFRGIYMGDLTLSKHNKKIYSEHNKEVNS